MVLHHCFKNDIEIKKLCQTKLIKHFIQKTILKGYINPSYHFILNGMEVQADI